MNILLIPILLPIVIGVLSLGTLKRLKRINEIAAVLACLISFAVGAVMFGHDAAFSLPWAGFGFDFSLRIYPFSAFILCSVAAFGALIAVYASAYSGSARSANWFFFYLTLTVGFASGVALADNLLLLLFFWEGLLITLYTFIVLGNKESKTVALKAFIINGAADLCLLLGVAIAGNIAGTMDISKIAGAKIQTSGWGAAAFALMSAGALAKGGAMPFHSWIPDAAVSAPVGFMAFLPGALEKLLGIYLLTRIALDIFSVSPAMRLLLMTVGGATLILAVSMALIQKDYKRLLSYHAISQVGYMVLGIGTGNPWGIAGGLFHMINNAVYKSCLFLTGGAVEKQTGTTDISKLGGLGKNMPVTSLCYMIAAASISGVPPFNGFFSKEMIFEGALRTGYPVFYAIAVAGAVLTFASFLKLGHAVYFGERPKELANAGEADWRMLAPMIVLAAVCVLFGFGGKLPLRLIAPSIAASGIETGGHLGSFHPGPVFFGSMAALVIALLNHIYGFTRTGKAYKAADHIHYAPVLRGIYGLAEKGYLDPYKWGMELVYGLGFALFRIDRMMDWLTDTMPAAVTMSVSRALGNTHNSYYPNYFAWVLLGVVIFAFSVYK